jgi:hypothetical protein
MALVLKDRVLESSTSSGTGSFTLSGAQTGFQSFSVIGNGNTTYYTIQGKNSDGTLTGEWEVGVGTWSTGGTLSRDTVLESSNSNNKVAFSIGLKDVFCDLPAEYAGGSMTYPGAGIANSTGSAWGTSYTTSGTGTVVALATGATIDNATIGSVTAGTGAFTYLSTSSTTSTTPVLSFNASNSGFAMGATISGSYLQTVLQNKSNSVGSSTNYVLSNNLGTDSTYYGEFGMNASTYSSGTPSDFFSLNNGVYFSSHDGDVTIGSGNGYKTYFAWGTTGDKAHVINASGAIGLNTSITGSTNFGTSGQVLTSAGSSATPTWTTPTTGTVTSVGGTGTVNGISLSGTVTSSGNLTLGGTLSGIGNSQLTNSSVTFNGVAVALGASGTITANTTNALTIGTGLSGTSFNGSGAVTIAIDSTVATLSGTQTLTNKRVTPRVSTTTSSATPTINTDNVDMYGLTAQAVDITSFTTNLSGTPTDGQKLWIYIVGTAARAITWGASFESSTATLPTTTVTTNRLDVGFVWNAATSKWRCVAVA